MAENSQSQSLSETQGNEESVNNECEGTRLTVLRDVVGNTLKAFTRNLKLLKPIPNVDTSILRHLQTNGITQMEKNMKCEFDQMCDEENIEHLLNNLDRIAEAQSERRTGNMKGWRSSGDIDTDLRSHTVTIKQEKLKALQKLLIDFEGQNKLLRSKAEKKEQRLIQTQTEIREIVDHISEITDTERTAVNSLN